MVDDAHLTQAHEQRGSAHAVHALELNQLLVAELLATAANLPDEMCPWRQERTRENARRLFMIDS